MVTMCLCVVDVALLFYLAPKSVKGCFPTTHSNELYLAKGAHRTSVVEENNKFYLRPTLTAKDMVKETKTDTK